MRTFKFEELMEVEKLQKYLRKNVSIYSYLHYKFIFMLHESVFTILF